MTGSVTVWTIETIVPAGAAESIGNAMERFAPALSSFEEEGGALWRLVGYADEQPDITAVRAAIAVAAASAGIEGPEVSVVPLPPVDWLAENRKSFPPIRAGRFFVRATLRDDRPPAGAVVLALDAGPAFGSGTHETTRGCLTALDRMAQGARPRRVLDLGTGSGILAIAAARLWQVPVWATDIDPVAVRTTSENAVRNGVAPRIRAFAGPGLRALPHGAGRFDLVFANILARPLIDLAGAIVTRMEPGATLVLSGLLSTQANAVSGAYRARRLLPLDRIDIGQWSTLMFRKS